MNIKKKLTAALIFFQKRPACFFMFMALALSIEFLCMGAYSWLPIHDNGDSNVPRLMILTRDYAQHGVSYWLPQIACGVDRLSEDLTYFSINSAMFFIAPPWLAYQILVLMQYFCSGYFTYRLCRDSLHLGNAASAVAGSLYSASLVGYIYSQFGFVLAPFYLWAFDRLLNSSLSALKQVVVVSGFGLLYSFTVSLPLSYVFVSTLTVVWVTFLNRKKSTLWKLCLLSLFILVPLLVQFGPLMAMILNSTVSQRGFRIDRLTLERALAFISEDRQWSVYNVFTLLLLALGVYTRGVRFREFNICMLLLLFTTLGACLLRAVFVLTESLSFVPLRGFQFDRFYELAPLMVALCAAYGFESLELGDVRWFRLCKESQTRKIHVCLSIFIILACGGFANEWIIHLRQGYRGWLSQGSYHRLFQSTAFNALPSPDLSRPFRVATVADILHPALLNAYGYETPDGYLNMYSRRYELFWSQVIHPATTLDDNLNHYFNDWGNRIYLFRPGFSNRMLHSKDIFNINLLSLANTKYVVSFLPIETTGSPLEEISTGDPKPSSRLQAIRGNFDGIKAVYIYKNRNSLDRVRFVQSLNVYKSLDELNTALAEASIDELRNTVFFESSEGVAFDDFSSKREVHVECDVEENSPDRIHVLVGSRSGGGFLVISNSYSRFWKCTVDGQPRKLLQAYGCFWGVYLHEIDKSVAFSYEPPYGLM